MQANEGSAKKQQDFLERALHDIGAAYGAAMVVIGDKLGLYKAMADSKPVQAAELAARTGTSERYVREWLSSQAAGGYIEYHPGDESFSLPPEHVPALTEDASPVFLPGSFQTALGSMRAVPRIAENFRTGAGMAWGEHDPDLFEGLERSFRPAYLNNLVSTWIPALAGMEARLQRGATVADIGCGHGFSTILMARAFPRSTFVGFDAHPASVEVARQRAAEAGVGERVSFEVADAVSFPGSDYDLICHLDCLHDMGDPLGAARRAYEALAPEGSWMIVEPFAHDRLEDNLNPVGRIYFASSTLVCVPASLANEGPALGAQAGQARIGEIAAAGGFTRFRVATASPFNMVLEAQK